MRLKIDHHQGTLKRYTSPFLKSVAFAYVAFPVFLFPIFVVIFDIAWTQVFRLLISPLFYFVTFWTVLAGYGLWEMRRWSWSAFLVANALLLYWAAVALSEYGQTHHKGLSYFMVLCGVGVLVVRVAREVRVPYFHPRIRWWETNPRYRLSVPVELGVGEEKKLRGEILDISKGGCFIKIRESLRDDQVIDLSFDIFRIAVRCRGVVVWRSESTVTHPKGYGVKFTSLGRNERRSLRFIEQRLRKIASFYRSARFLMEPEEFSRRLEQMESEDPRMPSGARK